MASKPGCGCSLPFPLVVLFVFLGLRLSGATDWNWVWVLSPLWVGLAFSIVFYVLMRLGLRAGEKAVKWAEEHWHL